MTHLGHEELFPQTRMSGRCGFRKETIAGVSRNGRDAPKAAVRRVAIKSGGSTHLGRSLIRQQWPAIPTAAAQCYSGFGWIPVKILMPVCRRKTTARCHRNAVSRHQTSPPASPGAKLYVASSMSTAAFSSPGRDSARLTAAMEASTCRRGAIRDAAACLAG